MGIKVERKRLRNPRTGNWETIDVETFTFPCNECLYYSNATIDYRGGQLHLNECLHHSADTSDLGQLNIPCFIARSRICHGKYWEDRDGP